MSSGGLAVARNKIIVKAVVSVVLLIAVSGLVYGKEPGPGQDGHFEVGLDLLPADDFDSLKSRLALKHGLGQAGDYRLHGSLKLAHRQTGDNALFPDNLYSVAASLSASNRSWHFVTGIESSSDRPFDSTDEVDVRLRASREVKRWNSSQLHLGLFYSSQFGFPLPLVSYNYSGEKVTLMLGVPMARLRWVLTPNTTLKASYLPVRQFRLSLVRRLTGRLSLAVEGVIEEEDYLVADRLDKDNALVLETRTVRVHLTREVYDSWKLGIYAGYSFDNRFFEREGFGDKDNQQDFDDAWVGGLNLRMSY